MIMKIIDERTNKNFFAERNTIRMVTTKGVLSYYSEFLTKSVLTMLVIAVVCVTSVLLLQKVVLSGSASVLVILCWASSWFLLATAIFTGFGELINNKFMPYTLRQYKVLQLIKRIKKAGSYEDIHSIFDEIALEDLSVLTKTSAKKVYQLWVWSDEEFIAHMNEVATITHVASNNSKMRITFNDYLRTKVTIPIVKRVKGEESAIILTDTGIVYQKAA